MLLNTDSLSVCAGSERRLALGWLILALGAIGVSTLFALMLVVSRTPFLNPGFFGADFFTSALVLHVDLAVLVWFMAFAGVIWSLLGGRQALGLAWLALMIAVIGVGLMIAARFLGEAHPVLSNYIPVLRGPVFLSGLGLFGVGVSLMLLRALWRIKPLTDRADGLLRLGAWSAAVVVLMALLVLGWNYLQLPPSAHYFEHLFWGTGHLLQFSHVLLMMVVWLVLAQNRGLALPSRRTSMILLLLALLPVPAALFIQWWLPADSMAYRLAYTQLMRLGSWPAALVMAVLLLRQLLLARPPLADQPEKAVLARVLLLSMLLFIVGLISGSLIRADNVMVTAHYHGTVGSVTLAFMGMTYYLLPRLGAVNLPAGLMRLQVGLYGGGMLTLIAGLLWSGLHGVQRKTPGEAQLLDSVQEVAGMMLMGTGGLIALLATWLFLLLTARALWPVGQSLLPLRTNHSG